ncbi:MAG: O-antigen ligase family protein [Bacteroidota bacterium]
MEWRISAVTKYLDRNRYIKVFEAISFLTLLLLIPVPHLALNYLFSYGAFVNEILHFIALFLIALILIASLSRSNSSLTFFDVLILCFGLLNLLNSDNLFNLNETSSVILNSVLCYFTFNWIFEKIGEYICFKYLTLGILIAVMLQATYFALQSLNILLNPNHLFDVGGSFGHPGYTLGVLSLGILMVISNNAFTESDKYLQIAIIASFVTIMLLSVAMGARASIVVSGISLFVLLNRYHPSLERVLRKYKIAFLILIASIGSALFFLKSDSLQGRYFIWKNSVQLIAQKPLLGFGSNTFTNTYNTYQIDYFRSRYGSEQEKHLADFVILAYNDFLETGVELGLPGTILLLTIFTIYPLYTVLKNGNWESLAPFVGIFIFMNTWGILHEQAYGNLVFTFLAFWKQCRLVKDM